ncbi:hypothetical protein GXW78_26785 [Roseomonas terrae]|uniref:Uncharacterized protein n=1 Tax=Neoroseomonas terrae TaxID=424799 RepID=A0ABS5EQJ6_9PROT|nr:hypothetical protein [Neoroseomonas terrae]
MAKMGSSCGLSTDSGRAEVHAAVGPRITNWLPSKYLTRLAPLLVRGPRLCGGDARHPAEYRRRSDLTSCRRGTSAPWAGLAVAFGEEALPAGSDLRDVEWAAPLRTPAADAFGIPELYGRRIHEPHRGMMVGNATCRDCKRTRENGNLHHPPAIADEGSATSKQIEMKPAGSAWGPRGKIALWITGKSDGGRTRTRTLDPLIKSEFCTSIISTAF